MYCHNKIQQNKHLINTDKLNKIDLVITGGGFKNSYAMGIFLFLNKLKKYNDKINFDRISGTSAGACTGFFIINDKINDYIHLSYSLVDTLSKYPYARPKYLWNELFKEYVNKYGIPKKDKLHISFSVLDYKYPFLNNEIVSSYDNEEDLIDAFKSTSSIPYLMVNFFGKYKNKYTLDGYFTNNTPIFKDNKNKQLIINFTDLKDEYDKVFLFTKDEITEIIIKGINDIIDFLNGKEISNIKIM